MLQKDWDVITKRTAEQKRFVEERKKQLEIVRLREVEDSGLHSVRIGGKDYFVDFNQEQYRSLLKRVLEQRTGHPYAWFKEERAFKHWVLYRTDHFSVRETDEGDSRSFGWSGSYLHCEAESVEVPFNLSSVFLMFSRRRGKVEFTGQCGFNGVIDGVGAEAYSDAVTLSLPNVLKVDRMFYHARIGNKWGADFGKRCYSFKEMFQSAIVSSEGQIGKIDLGQAIDVRGMFKNCCFYKHPWRKGDHFSPESAIDVSEMFHCSEAVGIKFFLPEAFEFRQGVFSWHAFYGASELIDFPIKGKTNREIVAKLKEVETGDSVEKMELFRQLGEWNRTLERWRKSGV